MPAAFVKTPADERHWAHAKERVKEQYPDLSEDDDRFWALTTAITKKMGGLQKNILHDLPAPVVKALVERACTYCPGPVKKRAAYLRKTVAAYRGMEAQQHSANMQKGVMVLYAKESL